MFWNLKRDFRHLINSLVFRVFVWNNLKICYTGPHQFRRAALSPCALSSSGFNSFISRTEISFQYLTKISSKFHCGNRHQGHSYFSRGKDVQMTQDKSRITKQYLLASDFDQTLSFNDSGIVLSELLGSTGFEEKVAGLSRAHLVQQGAELAYLLLHDPEYRCVRREHLIEAGKRIHLKENIRLLSRLLNGLDGYHFSFYVISAAPEEVIQSALEGIVPKDHIYGTRFEYDSATGEIQSIHRVAAGYGSAFGKPEALRRSERNHAQVCFGTFAG